MAALGHWTGATTSLLPGTAWASPNGMFPSEPRNDGYTFDSALSRVTLPNTGLADGYVLIADFTFVDTSNGRCNPQGRFIQSSGAGAFLGQASTGYNRDNSEDTSFVRCWGFASNPSGLSQFDFQWRRDTDAPTGGTVQSEFWVIPIYYSDIGLFESSSNACPGGTTINQITGFSGADGSNITLSGDTITLSGDNKNYLVLGGAYWQGIGNARTQRWKGLSIDGAQENAAKAYSYGRNGANADIGDLFSWIVQTGTVDRTIDAYVYRGDGVANLQGGANVNGNTTGSNAQHALAVIELPDSAEIFVSRATSQSADLSAAGPIDLDIAQALDINDSASFTQSGNAGINVEQDCDVLFGANISGASNNVSTGARYTGFAELTVDGLEDPNSVAGDYLRNNQGSQDTFGWSANLLGAQSVTAGQDLGISVTELPGSEGGGNMVSPAGWSGFWGINLDSLQDSSLTLVDSDLELLSSVRSLTTSDIAARASVRENTTNDLSFSASIRQLVTSSNQHIAHILSGAGTLYWVVYPSGQADPVDTEIISGSVPNGIHGSDVSPTATTDDFQGSEITGLTPGTSYKLASVWDNGSGTSNVAISASFTTSGGLTLVNSDLELRSRISALTSSDLQLRQGLRTVVVTDQAFRASVRESVSQDFESLTNIASLVSADSESIANLAQLIGANSVQPSNLSELVSQEAELLADIRVLVSRDASLLSNIISLSIVGANLSALANLAEIVSSSSAQISGIKGLTQSDSQLLSSLRGLATADTNLVSDLMALAHTSIDVLYDVLALGLVGSNLSAVANVKALLSNDIVTLSNINEIAGADSLLLAGLRETVLSDSSLPSSVKESAGSSLALLSNLLISQLVSADLNTAYQLAGLVTGNSVLSNSILNLSGNQLELPQRILAAVAQDVDLTHRVLQSVGQGSEQLYSLSQLASLDLDQRYQVLVILTERTLKEDGGLSLVHFLQANQLVQLQQQNSIMQFLQENELIDQSQKNELQQLIQDNTLIEMDRTVH